MDRSYRSRSTRFASTAIRKAPIGLPAVYERASRPRRLRFVHSVSRERPRRAGFPINRIARRTRSPQGYFQNDATTLNAELRETVEQMNLGDFCGLCGDRREFLQRALRLAGEAR